MCNTLRGVMSLPLTAEGEERRDRWIGRAKRKIAYHNHLVEALQRIADGEVDWGHKPADEMRQIAQDALDKPL